MFAFCLVKRPLYQRTLTRRQALQDDPRHLLPVWLTLYYGQALPQLSVALSGKVGSEALRQVLRRPPLNGRPGGHGDEAAVLVRLPLQGNGLVGVALGMVGVGRL